MSEKRKKKKKKKPYEFEIRILNSVRLPAAHGQISHTGFAKSDP